MKTNELKQKTKEVINLFGELIEELDNINQTDYQNQLPVDNFWMELTNLSNGKQRLSTIIEGKHWVGFLEEREMTSKEGKTFTKTSANMQPCNWDKCRICDHSDNRNLIDSFIY